MASIQHLCAGDSHLSLPTNLVLSKHTFQPLLLTKLNLQLLKSLSAAEDSTAVTSDMLMGQNLSFSYICILKEYKISNRYLQ